jgi:hypothetical protein
MGGCAVGFQEVGLENISVMNVISGASNPEYT